MIRVNSDLNRYGINPLCFNPINDYIRLNWYDLWINKYDNVIKIYESIRGKYNIIDESFNYYLGLFNLAIVCIKKCMIYPEKAFFTHIKIDNDNYYNPLYFKIDVIEREYSEYIKYLFFEKNYSVFDVKRFIDNNMQYFRLDVLICRLLYPNYYFNTFDEIIIGNSYDKDIFNIIRRHREYELFLNYCFSLCGNNEYIKKISF